MAGGKPVSQFEHSGEITKQDHLYRIRHSLAHVLAQAVLALRPGSTLGFGPPIKDGFYYDFILSAPLTEDDFPALESKMREILKHNEAFTKEELPAAAALARIDAMGAPYKREYAAELVDKHGLDTLSFYTNGSFLDMCEGPHVATTQEIPSDAFRLRSIAGAYWRGDSDNIMMTRLYAWAFASKEKLDACVAAWGEAQARDHKKLGRELEIFALDNAIGRGLPLWLPNGVAIRDELEKLATELEFKAGYQRVATPHLAKASLYRTTGHLPYYADNMYPTMDVVESSQNDATGHEKIRESYVLRPMNCPHHHRIFATRPRSYRDLPMRLAEYGQVYRFEESGAVSGLVRTRAMCMNDAHVYCTAEQIEAEFRSVMAMYREAYRILGLTDYRIRLSRWDPNDSKRRAKYVDDAEAWQQTETILQNVLDNMGVDYVEGIGEAAFYGPKIDLQFNTITGREETLSTVQLDFAVPKRMGLVYVGSDGQEHTPYCIHRAPFSTHERMVAFLLEHFGGAFPSWLAPVQVQVVTVSEKFAAYGDSIVSQLKDVLVRASLASDNDTVPRKIRAALTRKIPNILVVGAREVEQQTVTLRRYGTKEQKTMGFEEFKELLLASIQNRSDAVWAAK